MQGRKEKATIRDVATGASISIVTVFRVLSGSDYPVKEELKMTITDAAETLDCRPDLFGQLLRGDRSHRIGAVVPSIISLLYSQLVTVVQRECMDNDYVPISYSSYNQVQAEYSCVDMLIQVQVAGVLLSLIHQDGSINSALDEAGISYVLFDQPHDDYDGAAINFGFYSSGRLVAKYLIENGHRELAFVSGPVDRSSRKKLFKGSQDALTDHHMELREDNILVNTTSKKSGASAMKDYQRGQELGSMVLERKRTPDALFTVNDMMIVGIMKQLETHQIRIPRDMSILGFDDMEFDEMIAPALTTTSQPAYRTGELAVKLLAECLDGVHTWKKRVMLGPVLVERESMRGTQRAGRKATMKELQFKKVRLKMFDTRKGMSRETAREAAACMRQMLAAQKEINCVFAAASSQDEFLEHLILEEGINWSRVNGYYIDEYVGLDIRCPDSSNGFLTKAIFFRVLFKSVHLINGANSCHEEVERYSRSPDGIQTDITSTGIGESGHITLSDPTVTDLHDMKTAKVVELDEIRRQQQVNNGCFPSSGDMPEEALIVTILKLVSAKEIFCIMPTEKKRCAVKAALAGAVTGVCPTSIPRIAGDVHMYIDKTCYWEQETILIIRMVQKTFFINPGNKRGIGRVEAGLRKPKQDPDSRWRIQRVSSGFRKDGYKI